MHQNVMTKMFCQSNLSFREFPILWKIFENGFLYSRHVYTPGGGGGTPYDGLYWEAPPERGRYPFQVVGIKKGRDFTS